MEWKLFEGEPEILSAEWHNTRESAHHLEESSHRERLLITNELVRKAVALGGTSVVDLGCGDGGLLSLIKDIPVSSWGYDLSPKTIDYAVNVRGVDARYTDFVSDDIEYGDIAVMTEVLEHMKDPHKVVRELPSKYLVASSPFNENAESHYEFHLWAWDKAGYDALITQGGYSILEKRYATNWSQIILAVRDGQ